MNRQYPFTEQIASVIQKAHVAALGLTEDRAPAAIIFGFSAHALLLSEMDRSNPLIGQLSEDNRKFMGLPLVVIRSLPAMEFQIADRRMIADLGITLGVDVHTVMIGLNKVQLADGSKQITWNDDTFVDAVSPEAARFLMTCLHRAQTPQCFGRRMWR